MAVYKATYCYPFLNSLDPRTTLDANDAYSKGTAVYLQCKVDTSNMNITGYKIRILDESGNVIFPSGGGDGYISPISELIQVMDENDGTNTGINGTYLKIPFFQNLRSPILYDHIDTSEVNSFLQSRNSIYFQGDVGVRSVLDNPYAHGWSFTPGEDYDYEYSFAGSDYPIIDGEYVMDGQLILVINGVGNLNGVGQMIVDEENHVARIRLLPINRDYSVVSLQGKEYRDSLFNYNDDSHDYISYSQAGWKAFGSSEDLNFDVQGHTYKWEITLYQGEVEKYPETTSAQENSAKGHIYREDDGNGNHAYYVSYDKLDNKWYDNKLSAGQIMGSTPERVQISSVDMKEIPNSTAANPLVLQTRFIQLMNSPTSFSDSSSRVYIQSYDASLGHVYPLQDSLSAAAIENAQYCRFYKHSNDPEYILNTDIVDWGLNDVYIFYMGYRYGTADQQIFIPSATTERLRRIAVGNTILVTNAKDYNGSPAPERNGVYTVLQKDITITNDDGTFSDCITLKRAPSYQNWAAYIGKVIYCAGGLYQGENLQCLASAGAFNLWDPRNTSGINGSSPLLFTREQPILLFNNQIYKTVTVYEGLYDFTNHLSITIDELIDSYVPCVGDIILFRDHCFGEVTEIHLVTHPDDDNEYSLTLVQSPQSPVPSYKYIYIMQGENYGGRVFYNNVYDSSSPNYDLFTAKVLHNTEEVTFISPYVGLKPGMKLKLSNNKQVFFHDNTSSNWLDVAQLNTTLWYIKTAKHLLNPLEAYNNMDKDVPWKYEVRSHYKASDENPFYCYETPYLNIKINDHIIGLKDQEINYVTLTKQYEYPYFYDHRVIRVSALYNQSENISWNSYRYVLLDRDNNILQDTGDQYSNAMDVDFYGLTNESDRQYTIILYVGDDKSNTLTYSIKLSMKGNAVDGLHIPFHAEYDCDAHAVKLTLQDNGKVNPVYLYTNDFSQTSIESYVETNVLMRSDYDFSTAYLQENPLGNSGSASTGWLSITGVNNQSGIPVNVISEYFRQQYTDGPVAIDSGWISDEAYYYRPYTEYQPSIAISLGMNYGAFFANNELSISDDEQQANKCLTLGNESNEFYFTSAFILNDNFCGDCVTVNVEGEYNEHHNIPIQKLGDITYGDTNTDLSGYLSFGINIPDNFILDNNTRVLNPNRLHLGFFIDKDKNSDNEERKIMYTDDYNFAENPTYEYYYLQLASAVNNPGVPAYLNGQTEYLHFDLPTSKIWFKIMRNNSDLNSTDYSHTKYLTCIEKFLGNCCTVAPNQDVAYTGDHIQSGEVIDRSVLSTRLRYGPIYWAEGRTSLATTTNLDNKFIDGGSETFAMHYAAEDARVFYSHDQSWPHDTDDAEKHSYWIEEMSDSYVDFPTWNDVDDTCDHIEEFIALPRHPNSLSNQEYKVEYKIFDIQRIYDEWDNIHISYGEYNGVPENLCGEITLSLYNSNTQYFEEFAQFFIYYTE